MEGIEQNRIVYDLMSEMAFHYTQVNLQVKFHKPFEKSFVIWLLQCNTFSFLDIFHILGPVFSIHFLLECFGISQFVRLACDVFTISLCSKCGVLFVVHFFKNNCFGSCLWR